MFLIFEARKHNNPRALHVHPWCFKAQEEDNNARTRSEVHQHLNINVCDTAAPDTIDFSDEIKIEIIPTSLATRWNSTIAWHSPRCELPLDKPRSLQIIQIMCGNDLIKASSMFRCHDLRCQLLRTVPAAAQINTLRNLKIKFRRVFLPKVLGPRRHLAHVHGHTFLFEFAMSVVSLRCYNAINQNNERRQYVKL